MEDRRRLSMENCKEMGERLVKLRMEKGITRTDAAKKLHISTQSLTGFEQGKRGASLNMVLEFAQLYGTSLDYIVAGKTPEDQVIMYKDQVIANYKKQCELYEGFFKKVYVDYETLQNELMRVTDTDHE